MQYHPSSRIPTSNMSAYISSTPKAPLDLGTAEFIKGKPALVQPARDWRFYETTIIHNEQTNAALLLEYKDGGTWKEHYKTWADACEPLGKTRRQIDNLIKSERDIRKELPDSDKEETLATVNTLPDPMADIDANMPQSPEPPKTKGNGHMTGKALKDSLLENGESVTDYKRTHKAPSHSGKPIYAMPAWKELEEFIGKAINRTDAVNHLLPRPDLKKTVMGALKLAFSTSEEWHKLAKAL